MVNDLIKTFLSKAYWKKLGDYLGLGAGPGKRAIIDLDGLQRFVESRASHVSQTSLYGYMKTRAGTRFPELFENPVMLESINIAKWQIWLACVSDLSVYMGGLLCTRTDVEKQVQDLVSLMAQNIIESVGMPEDAGDAFSQSCVEYRERIKNTWFAQVSDDETAFSRSPLALVKWSPIADNLKRRDTEIVENSIRFRWIEVRRSARQLLVTESVLASGDQ